MHHENCLLKGVMECPLFKGCLNIEVNGRTVGTFRIVLYHGCLFKQGTPMTLDHESPSKPTPSHCPYIGTNKFDLHAYTDSLVDDGRAIHLSPIHEVSHQNTLINLETPCIPCIRISYLPYLAQRNIIHQQH